MVSINSFLKSIIGFSLSSWSGFFVSIIAVSLTTRLFTPEIMGGLNQFNNTSSLLVCFCAFGFDNAFIRYYFELPEGITIKELLLKCILSSVIVMVIVSLLLLSLSENVSMSLFGINNSILVVLLCINAFSMMIIDRYFTLIYRMSNRVKEFTICQVLLNITSKLFVLLAAFSEPTIENVCLYNTLGIFFLTIVYTVLQRNEFQLKKEFINGKGYKKIAYFAITSWPTNLIIRFNQFILPFLIGIYLDNYSIGIYASGLFFCSAFAVFSNGFNIYWSPFMYKNYKKQQDFIKRVHEYIVLFAIVIMSVMIAGQNIAYLLIGEQYHVSKIFFSMLLLEPMYSLIAGTTSYGISIEEKNEQTVSIYIISVLLNIIFAILFIDTYGLVGVAFGLGLSSLIKLLLITWRGQKYYKSINCWNKTFTGMLALFLLAFANLLGYYNNMIRISIFIILFMIVVFTYKNEIVDIKIYFIKYCKRLKLRT